MSCYYWLYPCRLHCPLCKISTYHILMLLLAVPCRVSYSLHQGWGKSSTGEYHKPNSRFLGRVLAIALFGIASFPRSVNHPNQTAELKVGRLFCSMYVSLMASSTKLFTSLSIPKTLFCNQEISCGCALEHLEYSESTHFMNGPIDASWAGGREGERGESNTFMGVWSAGLLPINKGFEACLESCLELISAEATN